MIPIASPLMGKEEYEAVKKVLASGWLTNGPAIKELEEKFSSYIGAEHAIAVNSGTSALVCALLAGKVKGEVITTPFSFVSSVSTIVFAHCTPVFVDIGEDFNIDEEKVAESITSKTVGILPVHLYGNPCEIDSLTELAEDHNLFLIEDACQAHGAEYKGRKVGSFGTGCFSFYPTKNMTTAEGGMITTSDSDIARRCRLLRNIGQTHQYQYKLIGYNFRMSEVSAAIGCEQLKKLDAFNERRIKNAEYLSQHLLREGIEVPEVEKEKKHVFNQYTIRVTDSFPLTRDELKNTLLDHGIGCRVYYPQPLHKLSLFEKYSHDNLAQSERASAQVLSLPVHPGVQQEDLDKICRSVGDAV